jgi:hypothetical protein
MFIRYEPEEKPEVKKDGQEIASGNIASTYNTTTSFLI